MERMLEITSRSGAAAVTSSKHLLQSNAICSICFCIVFFVVVVWFGLVRFGFVWFLFAWWFETRRVIFLFFVVVHPIHYYY